MKFFSKNNDSEILSRELIYKENRAVNNALIKEILIKEQFNFCAYTEKYIDELDSVEVEHFNSAKKYNDNYINYYAVLRKPNLWKKDESYVNESFFETLFFQNKDELNKRIQYVKGEFIFEEVDLNDIEAKSFLDFLGINNRDLYVIRKNHLKRLEFILFNLNLEQTIEYFNNHKSELSFISVIEKELDIDLSVFYS